MKTSVSPSKRLPPIFFAPSLWSSYTIVVGSGSLIWSEMVTERSTILNAGLQVVLRQVVHGASMISQRDAAIAPVNVDCRQDSERSDEVRGSFMAEYLKRGTQVAATEAADRQVRAT